MNLSWVIFIIVYFHNQLEHCSSHISIGKHSVQVCTSVSDLYLHCLFSHVLSSEHVERLSPAEQNYTSLLSIKVLSLSPSTPPKIIHPSIHLVFMDFFISLDGCIISQSHTVKSFWPLFHFWATYQLIRPKHAPFTSSPTCFHNIQNWLLNCAFLWSTRENNIWSQAQLPVSSQDLRSRII